MLKGFYIRSVDSYDNVGCEIKELSSVNLFYGQKNVGKTALSRFLANNGVRRYDRCRKYWVDNKRLEIYCYNSVFYNNVFLKNKNSFKGPLIFGAENADNVARLYEIKDAIYELENQKKNVIKVVNKYKALKSKYEEKRDILVKEVFKGVLDKRILVKYDSKTLKRNKIINELHLKSNDLEKYIEPYYNELINIENVIEDAHHKILLALDNKSRIEKLIDEKNFMIIQRIKNSAMVCTARNEINNNLNNIYAGLIRIKSDTYINKKLNIYEFTAKHIESQKEYIEYNNKKVDICELDKEESAIIGVLHFMMLVRGGYDFESILKDRVIILDNPTKFLDENGKNLLLKLLFEIINSVEDEENIDYNLFSTTKLLISSYEHYIKDVELTKNINYDLIKYKVIKQIIVLSDDIEFLNKLKDSAINADCFEIMKKNNISEIKKVYAFENKGNL